MATKKKTTEPKIVEPKQPKLSDYALEMYVVLVHSYGPANVVIKKIDSMYTEQRWADERAAKVREGALGSSVEKHRVNWPVV